MSFFSQPKTDRFRRSTAALVLDVGIFWAVVKTWMGFRELAVSPHDEAWIIAVIGGLLAGARLLEGIVWPTTILSWRWLGLAVVAFALSGFFLHGKGIAIFTPWEWGYLGAAALGLGAGLHVIRAWLDREDADGGESLRLVSLVLAAGWCFRPFLTSQVLGGLDAHWYGHVMIDALQQARAGVWPVFLGQGELMFNGAVHPFRTAPYHHHLGIGLDWLTVRTLTPLAVQHLTVVVTAVLGALMCYGCMVALEPKRRWLAWVMALAYVSGPAVAGTIYAQEMNMTFMAFGWLPLVVYGNIRLVRQNDAAGWIALVVGLAVVWTCHAPVGAWSSILSGGIQGMRLCARDFDLVSWRRAAGGALGFAGLTAYYFFSISELSPANAKGSHELIAYGAGAVVGLVALVRLLASGRWRWLGGGALALAVLWPTHRLYFGWLAGALLIAAALTGLAWIWPRFKLKSRVPEWAAVCFLVGGLAGAMVFPETDGVRLNRSAQAFDFMAQLWPTNLWTVSPLAQQLGDLQPGVAVLAALVVGWLALLVRPTWEVRLMALAGLGVAMVIFPFPRISPLLYQGVPDPLYGITTVSLWLRVMPVLVVVAIFAGFLAAANRPRGFWLSAAVLVASAELLFGHWWETSKFIRRGERAVNTSEQTAAFYRSENAQLYAYAYLGLPHPGYLMNGVIDYQLESRLLELKTLAWRKDPVLVNPDETRVTFTTTPLRDVPNWNVVEPTLVIAPGERRLLDFKFLDRSYGGTLIMKGPGFYRDYYLPEAGFYPKSFGVAKERPKTLAIWNTGEKERKVGLVFLNALPEDTGKPFGDFARVSMRTYRPEDLQIQTRSLIPYQAEVELKEAMYLETPRVFIPGYRARVDGISKPVEMSSDHLAMVRVEPGRHTVDVFYTGTFAARMLFRLSALTWLGLAGYGLWRWRRREVAAVGA